MVNVLEQFYTTAQILFYFYSHISLFSFYFLFFKKYTSLLIKFCCIIKFFYAHNTVLFFIIIYTSFDIHQIKVNTDF